MSDIIDDDLWDWGSRLRLMVKEFGGRWKYSKKRGAMIWKWKARKVNKKKSRHAGTN